MNIDCRHCVEIKRRILEIYFCPNQGDQPDDDDGRPDPEEARRSEDRARAELASLLLRHGAVAGAREPNGQQTPLHLCAMNGYHRTARVLVREGRANVDAVNKVSQTPLIYACMEQHPDTVAALLEAGADTTLGNKLHWDFTPMHWAVMQAR